MKLRTKKRVFLRSTELPVYVASLLLLFSAPVFAFQHSSCYLNDCIRFKIAGVQSTDVSDAGAPPCHTASKKTEQKKCNTDAGCDLQLPRTVADQDITAKAEHVTIAFIHLTDRNFNIIVTVKDKLLSPLLKPDAGFSIPPLYITNRTLLI